MNAKDKALLLALERAEGARRVANMAHAYPDVFSTEQLAKLEQLVGIVAQEYDQLWEDTST